MKPEKSPFEINWPLADSKLVENSAGSMCTVNIYRKVIGIV